MFTDQEGGSRGFFDELELDMDASEIVQVTTR